MGGEHLLDREVLARGNVERMMFRVQPFLDTRCFTPSQPVIESNQGETKMYSYK